MKLFLLEELAFLKNLLTKFQIRQLYLGDLATLPTTLFSHVVVVVVVVGILCLSSCQHSVIYLTASTGWMYAATEEVVWKERSRNYNTVCHGFRPGGNPKNKN